MNDNRSSAPTPEYGAPYLLMATKRTTVDIASRDESDSSAALGADEAAAGIAALAAGAPAPSSGQWSTHTLSSPPGKPRFEGVDLADLDVDQRRWLPDPVPEALRLIRCTACGSIRAEIPGQSVDPWKNHEDECDTFAATDLD